MPKSIRVTLTPEQLDDLNARARGRELAPHERDRLERVRLSHLGHTVPRIAAHLGRHQQTVRRVSSGFRAEGFAILAGRPRPGRPAPLTEPVLTAIEQRLAAAAAAGRTWAMPHLAAGLAEEHRVVIAPGWLAERLKARRFRRKRTRSSLRHQQAAPDRQAPKGADLEVVKA